MPTRRKWPVKAARRLRNEETSAEELLWRELRNRRLDNWKFRRQRRAKIESAGFHEIRFTNEDVRGRPAWVIEEIRRALDIALAAPMRPAHPRMD